MAFTLAHLRKNMLRPRDDQGVAVRTLVLFICVVSVFALTYLPTKAEYVRLQQTLQVESVANTALAQVNHAIDNDYIRPRRMAADLSTPSIAVSILRNENGSYCIKVLWYDPKARVRPALRGVCGEA